MFHPERVAVESANRRENDASRERVYEQIFTAKVNEKILVEFENDLSDYEDDFGIDDNAFENELGKYSDDQQKSILSYPRAVRKKVIHRALQNATTDGVTSVERFVAALLRDAEAHHWTQGYHVSPREIPSDVVMGYDMDDRDGIPMAYYSLDYKNLFRKNRGKFLYVVRAELDPNGTHKRDNTNNWGRASSLSIIEQLSLEEIDRMVEDMYAARERQKQQTSSV